MMDIRDIDPYLTMFITQLRLQSGFLLYKIAMDRGFIKAYLVDGSGIFCSTYIKNGQLVTEDMGYEKL